ncbi:response regulator transcription factor [Allosphingosinicella sp.]|uniref:response regulator transcription factor n=1 Tax=Allosphingosinicella sp. TaxID=2823234 RepID=UPI002FC1B893
MSVSEVASSIEGELIDRRVYVIDDDEAVRATLRTILTGAGIYSEEFGTAAEFLRAQPDLPIGCILLDLRMPEMSGLELLRTLKERGVPDPVVMISGQADLPDAVDAIKAGALDFIQKPFRKARLLEVLEQAFAAVREHKGREKVQRSIILSPREKEVLHGLAGGLTSKHIARELGISSRTVEMHRAKLGRKFGVQSMTRAVLIAKEAGLLD